MGPQHQLLQVPDLLQVPFLRGCEDALPQSPYRRLRLGPVDAVPGLGVVLRSVRRRGRHRRRSGSCHTYLRHPTCPSVRGPSQFYFTGLPDPRGLPFGPGYSPVSDELCDAAEESAPLSSGLSPHRRSLLGSSCPAGGLGLRYLRLTEITPGLQRGFHVPLPQDAAGVGSLLIPGPTVSSPHRRRSSGVVVRSSAPGPIATASSPSTWHRSYETSSRVHSH